MDDEQVRPLTKREKAAVDALMQAARNLPRNMSIEVESGGVLLVNKRHHYLRGRSAQVAKLRKASIDPWNLGA